AVNEAIEKQAPKNLDDAEKFSKSGKAEQVKEQVDGKVGEGKKSSAKDIETTTKAPPDLSKAKDKPVTPLTPDQPPANPGAPNAADAVPDKQPASVTDFSQGPKANDQAMAEADVTEEQLKKGNEPAFDQALSEKKKSEEHSAKAPAQARGAEAQQLSAAKSGAAASGAQAMTALTATRAAAGKQIDGGKGQAKSKDEEKRQQVTSKLQKVFDATKKDVEQILAGLDTKVDQQFTAGEKAARDAFMADQARRIDAYKKKRYSGFTGKLRWVKDKFKGLPAEANQLYQESRKLYVTRMQGVISSIADTIGVELGKAKARIATGRNELKAEVDKLPADLKKFGQEAAKDFAGKFDDLDSQVNEKSQQLVQDLATKYTQALNKIDEEIKKLQEANKGLIDKAKDAIVGVIKTINELKNLLMGILAKAAGAIVKIIKDPIGFLGNLVRAVGAGLQQFITNIADHLKKGLVSWLLGTAVKAGLDLPAKFDLKGIIQLIASLLGLTWANIRARVTRKGVPDQAMSTVESSVPIAQALVREGPAGAVKEISAEVGDLKSTILSKLTTYLIPTVIIAGITWILSLLNPASAFVRAVKGIIDIVTFVVNQGAQIIDFVNAVLDAVVAIAGGGAAGVPKMVEGALAASIPLLIGFLASLLGIGNLAAKVKSVFHAVSRPVNRAIDKVVDFIAKTGKKLWAKLKGRGKNKGTDGSAKDPAKERAAIADADRMLATSPQHKAAVRQLSSLSQRHGVPMRLVTESTDVKGEHVHVQTMKSDSHVLPAIDPTQQQELNKLKAEFVELATSLGCDGGKAAAVATFQQGRGSADDFIRELEGRAIKVVRTARNAPQAVKADLQKLGMDFALRRQGTAGAPGEFANVFEYYMTLWADKRAAAAKKMQADFAAGLRDQPTKRELKEETARLALAELQGSPHGAESALYRDRAKVEGLNRGGVTADPTLSEDQLVAHIRAQAGQLKFGSTTGAAYHSRAHRGEIPESRREARSFIANYHAAAETVVKEGRAQFYPVPGGGTRQVRFIAETTDDAGGPVTLTVMIYARADGRVVMATFGSFLKN
ncbi:hypothetical protein ACFFHI_23600, partial [Streptomyces palmae]